GESEETQAKLYEGMLNELFEESKKQAAQEAEKVASLTTNDKQLNAADRKFYNEINKNVGYKEETLIPEETIDRIFENLTTEHPLLSEIGLKNAGLRLKFLKSETSGTA
ncbi:phage major capsid protein, partial [Staphylococcus epidermidis]